MLDSPRTFPCPNCKEMINDSMKQCSFCSVPLDPGVAQLIADKQERANQAYSDASYLRSAAIAMYVFLALSFIPYIPLVSWGFLGVFIVVTVLLFRWQIRFGSLQTDDADYQTARRSWRVSLVLFIFAIPLGFIVRPIVYLLILAATTS